MENEKEILKKEIDEIEAVLFPKRARLNELYHLEADTIEAKVKRTHQGRDAFRPEELVFAARNRCDCGAGLAYPEGIGFNGSWECSHILMGCALPASDPASKQHTGSLPFTFYEIKSENQPSANGATTRPQP